MTSNYYDYRKNLAIKYTQVAQDHDLLRTFRDQEPLQNSRNYIYNLVFSAPNKDIGLLIILTGENSYG